MSLQLSSKLTNASYKSISWTVHKVDGSTKRRVILRVHKVDGISDTKWTDHPKHWIILHVHKADGSPKRWELYKSISWTVHKVDGSTKRRVILRVHKVDGISATKWTDHPKHWIILHVHKVDGSPKRWKLYKSIIGRCIRHKVDGSPQFNTSINWTVCPPQSGRIT